MKKTILKSAFVVLSFLTLSLSQLYADVTKTVGSGGNYTTLKSAFDAINAGTVKTGAITLQIISNTTETASAKLNASGTGSSNYSSVIIYPTASGCAISGVFNASVIYLSGADNVTIDGRVNQTGAANLSIINTNSSSTSPRTLLFDNDASLNIVKYCYLKGAASGSTGAVICFSTTTGTTGNDNNTIDHCYITNSGSRPTNAIFSQGTSGKENDGIVISNNNIYDFFTTSASSNGINIGNYNYAWTITGNSFYETTTFVPQQDLYTYAGVKVNNVSGNNFIVKDNYIGGSAPQCGGTAFTISAAKTHLFQGIYMNVGNVTASSLQNNTIKNLSYSSTQANPWYGISIAAGSVDVGTITGNTIGSSTGTGSIIVNGQVNNTNVYGIYIASTGTINCNNNTIGSIISTNSTSSAATNLYGIYKTNSIGVLTVDRNSFGSLSTANSIQAASASTATDQLVMAVYSASSGSITISNNIISNLNNVGTFNNSTFTNGLVGIGSYYGSNTITGNTIHDISCSNNTTIGIMQRGQINGTVQIISNNTIYNLSNTNSSDFVSVYGISYNGYKNGANVVNANFIHSLSIASTDNTSLMNGLDLISGGVTSSNNIINLGAGITNNHKIIGIRENGIAGQSNNIYFNTVYISGNPSGITSNTYAYYTITNKGTTDIRNNIFVNARSGGTTGKHYVISLPGLAGLTMDYNDYYFTGSGGLFGNLSTYDKADLAAWQSGSGKDINSLSIDPGFTNAGGTSALYYKTSASLPGISGTGLVLDYAGVGRGITPVMGALENNNYVWQGGISTNFGIAGNWVNGVVPPDGADISFAINPSRSCLLDQNRILGSVTNAQSTDILDLNRKQLTITKNVDLTNGAKIDASGVSSTIVFAGTTAQSIPSGAFVSNTIYALNINNGSGLTQNGDLIVTQTLSLTNGAYTLGANTLTVNGAISSTFGSLIGGSTTNIIIGGGGSSSNTTLPAVSLNNLTLNRTLGLSLGGNVSVAGTLVLTDGVLAVGANTFTISGNSPTRTSGSIDASNAGATLVFANTSAITLPASIFSAAVNNLTISGVGCITASSDFTVNGVLNLAAANASSTKGSLNMWDGSAIKTLTMGANGTTIGVGDVTGTVKRTSFALNTPYTFGNQYTTMNMTLQGTMPSEVSFTITLTASEPSWMTTTTGIYRYYEVRQVGCDEITKINLNLHYLDSELNGATEGRLDFFDDHVSAVQVHDHGQSNYNISENWVGLANLGLNFVSSSNSPNLHYWSLGTSIAGNSSVWVGGSPSGTTNWNLPGNWSGSVPTAISNVIIPDVTYNPVIPSNITITSLSIQAGGIVDNAVGYTVTIAGAEGSWNNLGTYNAGSSTVVFTNAGATMAGATNFYNLTVANGANLSLGTDNNLRIGNILTLSGTGVLDATISRNTIEYNGTNQTVIYPNGVNPGFYNLTLSGSGTKTLPATPLTILGDFTLSGTVSATAVSAISIARTLSVGTGTTFVTGNYSHTLGGNLDNDGTLTITTGNTMTMNGSVAQSILGANSISFYNLIVNNANGVSLFNDESVNNALTLLNGDLTLGATTLAINGSLTKSNGYLNVSPLSSLNFGGSSAVTFPNNLFSTSASINDLTINRSGGVALGNQDVTVNGLLALTSGTLTLGANKLALTGSPFTHATGNLNASNSGATLNLSCTSAVVLPTSIFTGSINNLIINVAGGVSTMSDLTINGILDLQSANPTATNGSLDMWDGTTMKTLTLGSNNISLGIGDVTGIITHQSITYGVTYYFGNPYTTAYFSNDGTLPSQVSLKLRIGVEPTWKTGGILREVEVMHTGGVGTKAIFSCHYLDSELNGNDENKLSFWMELDPSSFEYGRSANNTAENWVMLSSANLYFFPTTWDANRKITLDEYSDVNILTWNGSISDSWTSVQNWTPTAGPAANRNIIIPDASSTPNSPTLPAITEVKTLTIESAGVLNSVPNAQLTINGASAWNNVGGTFNASTSNVIFTNADASILGSTDFYNITTTALKYLWLISGSTLRIAGTFTNNGTLRTTINGPTTVEYNGNGPQTVVIPNATTNRYYNLILSGSGTKTLPGTLLNVENSFITTGTATVNAAAALNLKGAVTIGAGTALNTGTYSHTFVGNVENNGTITAASSGITTMNGTAIQIFNGTGTTGFYNLAVANTSAEGVQVNNNVTTTNLSIAANSKLTINSLAKVNVTSGITNSAGAPGLVVKANESAANGTLIFAGTPPLATVEMYSKASWNLTNPVGARYKWQFFGIPFSSLLASPTFDGAYVRRHDETGVTSNWIQLNNSSTMDPFKGYEITQQAPKTYSFEGTLVNSSLNQTLAVTSGARNPGQYILSNPYTAAIDITQMTFGTQTEASVYLYNTGSQQDWIDNSGGTTLGTSPGQYTVAPKQTAGTGGIPGQIPSMQGFLVFALSNSVNATIGIPYSSVAIKNTDKQRAPSLGNKISTSEKAYIRIDVDGSRYADIMWIFSEPTCTRGFDNGWDGAKFLGTAMAPQLFAMEEDGYYQVNSVDNINNTDLGFKAGEDSIYRLTFSNENMSSRYSEMYLLDLKDSSITDISVSGTEYKFKALPTDTVVKRFKIISSIKVPDLIEIPTNTNSQLKIYNSQNVVFVNNTSSVSGNLKLYDLSGRCICDKPFIANGITTIPINLPVGAYLAKGKTNNMEKTERLIVR